MKFLAASVLALCSLAASTPVLKIEERQTTTTPPPDQIRFQSVKASGSGCPTNETYQVDMTNDGTTLHFTYSNLIAAAGPGTTAADARRFCQHSINLFVPQGYRFSVLSADYRGYVSLPDAGTTSSLTSKYYFSGSSTTATLKHNFAGPIAGDDYEETDALSIQSLVWSPCGAQAMLQLNNAVAIQAVAGANSSLMTVDSNDLKVTQTFAITWARCTTGTTGSTGTTGTGTSTGTTS